MAATLSLLNTPIAFQISLCAQLRWCEFDPRFETPLDHSAVYAPALANAASLVPLRWAMSVVRAVSLVGAADHGKINTGGVLTIQEVLARDDDGCVVVVKMRLTHVAADALAAFLEGYDGWNDVSNYTIEAVDTSKKQQRRVDRSRDASLVNRISKACARVKDEIGNRAFLALVDRLTFVIVLAMIEKHRQNDVVSISLRALEIDQRQALERAIGAELAQRCRPLTAATIQPIPPPTGSYASLTQKFNTEALSSVNWPPRWAGPHRWSGDPRRVSGVVFDVQDGDPSIVPRGMAHTLKTSSWVSIW
tara:strand:+ start:454 stop:1371 length:918 start_codon:yes stop_codon:yes gene_type:complete